MRLRGLLGGIVALAACHRHAPATTDASIADARPLDAAAPTRTCNQGWSQLVVATGSVQGAASDGTTLYLSVLTSGGEIELQAVPIAGGSPATIATADDEQFYLASYGNAVFYAAHLGSPAYELHQLVGGSDTVLGSVAAVTAFFPVSLAANATDVYVLGNDTATDVSLWRVSRGGGAGSSPPVVASVASSSHQGLALGASVAAWGDANGVELVSLPGPSTPSVAQAGPSIAFIGDTGYSLGEHIVTSHSYQVTIYEFTPVQRTVYTSVETCHGPSSFFGDSRGTHYYETEAAFTTCGQQDPLSDLSDESGQWCNFDPSPIVAQDDTNLYGLEQTSSGSTTFLIIRKPP